MENNVEEIFEYATRNKLRFQYKGQLSTEDLWDLPVTVLDTIFKSLNAKVKAAGEESLLAEKSKADPDLTAQIAVVRHIVAVKLEEAEARRNEKANKERKQKILAIIAEKKDAALHDASLEDLEAMYNAID